MSKSKFLLFLFTVIFLFVSYNLFADEIDKIVEDVSDEIVLDETITDENQLELPDTISDTNETNTGEQDSSTKESDSHVLNTIFTEELEVDKVEELFKITEKQVQKFEKLFSSSLEVSEFSAKQKNNKYTHVFFALNGKEIDIIYQGGVRNYKTELVQTLEAVVKDIVVSDSGKDSPQILSNYNVFVTAKGNLNIGDVVLSPCLNGGTSSYVVTHKREVANNKFVLLTPLYEREKPIEGVTLTKKKKPLSFDITLHSSFIDYLSAGGDISVKYPLYYPFLVYMGLRGCYSFDDSSPLSTHMGVLLGAECQISVSKLFERRLPLSLYTRFDFSTHYQLQESKIEFASDFELGLRWYLTPLFALNTGARLYIIPESLINSQVFQIALGFSKII